MADFKMDEVVAAKVTDFVYKDCSSEVAAVIDILSTLQKLEVDLASVSGVKVVASLVCACLYKYETGNQSTADIEKLFGGAKISHSEEE